MKLVFNKIDKFSITVIFALGIGVVSSFVDFGIISVLFSVITPIIFIITSVLALYGLFKKKYYYLIGPLLYLLFYNFFLQFNNITHIEYTDSISILSYNVRAFKQPTTNHPNTDESSSIIKFIDSIDADILTLQESSYKEGQKINGYPYSFLGYRPNKDKSLLTIHSKYPIINQGFIDFPDTKNSTIYADIKINKDTITVYNSHLQSYIFKPSDITNKQLDYRYFKKLNNTIAKQIEQAKLIKRHANNNNKKIIICGDFNATPFSQTYRILKKELNDSFLNKGDGLGSTYSLLNYPLRLDYFLSNEHIEVINHENFNLNLSDHEPIHIKFKIL
ncbi:hypothetical protein ADIWIN_3997 [Winogradskyella psychrotolerans RS-3]|uniref:Endonuclease/exonuclease/phosphatase domain-containing protein n=1 Tax=Winogradskyella psychrotolerans RS-3 TaxID=641526 RepID=S7VJS7_9FLAO|nr:endonuclease/exonuclease/phosphatase family protein [Winogradskyella psychrotolerans]EPR69722.1 hypothetical protein ADIWIN_3997 [Winogradskyella psychrotolerans RS-3]